MVITGCARLSAPITVVSDPAYQPGASDSYVFAYHPDIRIEKRLLYDRSTEYLKKSGLRMVDLDSARYLIAVRITSTTIVSAIADYSSSPSRTLPEVDTRTYDGRSLFNFAIYRRNDLAADRVRSVWEATLVARQKDFRENEEQFIREVFSHLGQSHKGKIVIAKD